jgi:hypothetical protein
VQHRAQCGMKRKRFWDGLFTILLSWGQGMGWK